MKLYELQEGEVLRIGERIHLVVLEVTPDEILMEITEGGCTREEALTIAAPAREGRPTDEGRLPETGAGGN
jgi:hypothetical protein